MWLGAAAYASGDDSSQADAQAPRFQIDPVHTQVQFSVQHAGFSSSTGKALRPRGVVVFDAKNWASASVEVTLNAAEIEFDDVAWNRAMRGARYFNAAEYPQIHFRSTNVQKNTDNTGILHGELTLLGIAQPVTLRIVFNKRARHPYTLKDTIGFSASGTLSRAAFGMTATPKTVGDKVRVRIALEAQRLPAPSAPSAGRR
jgi:polyisoprenoid-binding protein YceI